MKFIKTNIPDVIILEPKVHGDHRGYFFESYRRDKLEEFLGYSVKFCQDNESKSVYGTLRGMHYQVPPFAQSKLVRVIQGEVLDVAVDIRKDSETFGEKVEVILSGENKRQLFIPRGFAHGFVVLSETAIFSYKCDNYYQPEFERGFAFNDSEVAIDWILKTSEFLLSEKDKNQPRFQDAEKISAEADLYE